MGVPGGAEFGKEPEGDWTNSAPPGTRRRAAGVVVAVRKTVDATTITRTCFTPEAPPPGRMALLLSLPMRELSWPRLRPGQGLPYAGNCRW